MKKLFFLLLLFVCICIACNDKKDDESTTRPFDFSKVALISEDEVVRMAAHYKEIIEKDPKQCIQDLNMDGQVLEAILYETNHITLIAAADLKSNEITAIIQLLRAGVPSYYRITEFFNAGQPGMRGHPAVCPPPDGCDLPLTGKTGKQHLISETDAAAMAKLYVDLVRADPAIAIRQINMDGNLLYALLYRTKGMQLIAGADLKTKEPTEIIQFWRGGVFTYYNIKDFFPPGMPGMMSREALCPPPDSCKFWLYADSSILIPNTH